MFAITIHSSTDHTVSALSRTHNVTAQAGTVTACYHVVFALCALEHGKKLPSLHSWCCCCNAGGLDLCAGCLLKAEKSCQAVTERC